jgi:hypothetical protein
VAGSRIPLPRDGDIVIARDQHDPTLYTLSVVPGTPQVRYASFEYAVAVAMEWALKTPVALWVTEDGRTFTALEPSGRRHA